MHRDGTVDEEDFTVLKLNGHLVALLCRTLDACVDGGPSVIIVVVFGPIKYVKGHVLHLQLSTADSNI